MLGGITGPGTGIAGRELAAVSAATPAPAPAPAPATASPGVDSVPATVADGNTSTDDDAMLAATSLSSFLRLASAIASAHHTTTQTLMYSTATYHKLAALPQLINSYSCDSITGYPTTSYTSSADADKPARCA